MVKKNSKTIKIIIKNRIYGHDRGWCFTTKYFKGLGSDAAIRKGLSRLEEKGFIRRLTQGLYEYPRKHKKLGFLPPVPDNVAKAIAGRDKIKIQPSGAYAANLLGLSEQVPSRIVFVTDGASKKIAIGKTEIIFRKTTAKNMANAGTPLGLVIQALKYLGKDKLTGPIVQKIKARIATLDKKRLQRDLHHAPAWIRELILELANG